MQVMFEITLINVTLYALALFGVYYLAVSAIKKEFIKIEPLKLFYYVSLFSVFGISGEAFVNTTWEYLMGEPLWEYYLFPLHGGNISYFFPLIWGGLGFYKYINDTAFHRYRPEQKIKPGIVMGAEAILVELVYNGFYLLLFGSYIFYYLPANLGPLSHLSCLQVIPFYFVVGFFTNSLIQKQNEYGYGRTTFLNIMMFWMIITAFLIVWIAPFRRRKILIPIGIRIFLVQDLALFPAQGNHTLVWF